MSRYPELTAKVDAFFARALARHGADMQCESGCSDCCHTRLSVTSVEAEAIRREISRWSDEDRAALRTCAEAAQPARRISAPDRCAALGADGRCRIYAVRPLVCRSHGAPIRLRENSLPVVQACFRNFPRGPEHADADCILDQTTLSALLLAVDRDAGGDGSRIDLAALLASC